MGLGRLRQAREGDDEAGQGQRQRRPHHQLQLPAGRLLERHLRVPVVITNSEKESDAVITLKNYYRRQPERLQQAEAKRTAKRKPDPSYQAGQLVLSNLIGAPAGGFVIGFVLDKWLGTQPWLLLIMLFLGFVGGFMNVMRISKNSTGQGPDEQG